MGVRTGVTVLLSRKTRTRKTSRKGDFRATASDARSATSIALCTHAKPSPFCDSFSQLDKSGGLYYTPVTVMPSRWTAGTWVMLYKWQSALIAVLLRHTTAVGGKQDGWSFLYFVPFSNEEADACRGQGTDVGQKHRTGSSLPKVHIQILGPCGGYTGVFTLSKRIRSKLMTCALSCVHIVFQ